MRTFRLAIAAAAIAILPNVASATTYNFSAIETSSLSSSPVNFTFSLDTSKATVTSAGVTTFSNVPITENGKLFAGNTVGAQYGTNISSPLFFFVDTGMNPFYTGSGTGITFNLASFPIAEGATDGKGTLTITSGTAAPTPEPASLVLLLTGCATAVGARRFSWRRA